MEKIKNNFEEGRENNIEKKEILETLLNITLLSKYEKINEGQNGIIGYVDTKQVREFFTKQVSESQSLNADYSEEDIKDLLDKKLPISENDQDLAVKMLKVFLIDQGRKEVEMQIKAYEAIKKAKADNPEKKFADVLNVYTSQEISLAQNEKLKEKLSNDAAGLSDEDEVFVFTMDFVPGQDMRTYLFRQILKKNGFENEDLELMDYKRLEKEVGLFIGGWDSPGRKSNNAASAAYEAEKVDQINEEKILQYSQNAGIEISKDIVDEIKNTLEVLHQNGLWHRDLHDRNLMFKLDNEGKITSSVLIDFGNSCQAANKDLAYDDIDSQHYFLDDEYIVRRLERLSKTKEEQKSEEKTKFLKQFSQPWQSVKEIIGKEENTSRSQKIKNAYKEFEEEVTYIWEDYETDKKEALAEIKTATEIFAQACSNDQETQWQISTSLLKDTMLKANLSLDDFKEFLEKEKEPLLSLQNKKTDLLKNI